MSAPNKDPKLYDVIVIGAGISGLSGAKFLKDFDVNLEILVLEARDRVGGRTYTVQKSEVGWVDLGGAYVGRSQNHLLRLIKEFQLEMYNVNEKENLVYYDQTTGQRSLCYRDQLPNIGLLATLDFFHIMNLMDRMGEQIPARQPWDAPQAEQWDRITFKQFIEENVWSKTIKRFMGIFISTCVCQESWESSLLWFLWYVKQCGGTRPIFSTTNGGQEFKLHGGTNQISVKLAEHVGWSRVRLEQPVHYLQQQQQPQNYQNDQKVEPTEVVILRTLNGNEYRARYVMMATPPAVQQKIHYDPPLSAMRNQLLQRTPMGSVYKCIVYYRQAFWRQMDMCGSLILYGDEQDDCQCPITYTLDDTKPDGTHPAIIGFMPGDKARKLAHLTKEQRLKLICETYAKAFGCEDAKHPIHYEEQNWMAEQYSGGCYTMTCAPGFLTRYGPYLRKPHGLIHFAGTETGTQWSGYMNGAIEAGERAAREILCRMGKINAEHIEAQEPVSDDYPPNMMMEATWLERCAPSARCFLTTTTLTTVAAAAFTVYFGWKRWLFSQYWHQYIACYIVDVKP